MPERTVTPRRLAALLAAVLAVPACTVEPGELAGRPDPLALPAAPAPTPASGLLSGPGVTARPCPDAVDPDDGCIHLGTLVDTSGPFAAHGEAALAGARAFWRHVNEEGGVVHEREDGITARYEVSLADHVADTGLEVEAHLDAYEELEPDVLALALSMGSATTAEALAAYQRDDMVAAPLGWWSGWAFEPLVAESGANYCFQAMNGLDWVLRRLGGDTAIDHLVVVHAPDRYGQDTLAGVEAWVDPDAGGRNLPRATFAPSQHAVTLAPGDDVAPAVERIVAVDPQAVVVATAPADLARLATATAEAGWDGWLVGMAPTFEPSLLEDDAVARQLEARYVRVANVGPLTQGGQAYVDMRDSLGLPHEVGAPAEIADDPALPENDAWVAGWVSQYPLHAALVEAVTAGDLTRAGLVDAIETAAITYDGALPATHYTGDPSHTATRRTFLLRPDRDAPLGQTLVADAFEGQTAIRRAFTRPCTEG